MTSVWLFEPRSHGREKEAARVRNGAPLPGRLEPREASLPVAVPGFGPALGCFCACARGVMSFGGVFP